MRPLPIVVLLVVLALAAPAAATATPVQGGRTGWLWSSALCKESLNDSGVQISDGRVFRGLVTFCAGLPGTCRIVAGGAYYGRFRVRMVDRNLVVRSMLLRITGDRSFLVTGILVHGRLGSDAEARVWSARTAAATAAESRAVRTSCPAFAA